MKIETTCIYCGTGCRLYLKIREGKVVAVLPSKNGPGEGRLCIKGWCVHEFIHHPDRLTKPLIRDNEAFREVEWSKALVLIADKLKGIKEKFGPDSIAFLSSAKSTNEENYLMQKISRAAVGTNNVDHCARLCHASTVTGLVSSFGSGAMTNSQEDVEKSDVIFVIGSNTTEQHPLLARRIIRRVKHGAKLIVADPRTIDLVEYADIYLSHKPGTDVPLLNSMMNVIIEERLHDEEFIKIRTEGFFDFRKVIETYNPKKVQGITGVSPEDIRKAAMLYGKGERASIFFSMGITQHTTGVDNVVSIANLAMLTGNVGREGTGVNPLRGQNNVQGACDMGALPDYLPGYRKVIDTTERVKFEQVWGVKIPSTEGLTLIELIDRCGKDIKAMFIMGENPMLSDPDLNHVKEKLSDLDFLVVSELFLSETAMMADVVLPAASFAEKDGTFTATDRRVQRVRKAIEPIGQCKPDWKILLEISNLLGYPMNYKSPAEVMNEINGLVSIYGGINYNRLEKEDLRWPCIDDSHPGTRILHIDGFSRGLGRFQPIEFRPPAEEPDNNYPYILTTGRLLFHWHTGTMTRRSETLTNQVNEAVVEINTNDALRLNISNGEMVKVRSRRGEITLNANVTDRIREGVVFIPFHYVEAAANKLTSKALDPKAKIPELKVCAVDITKNKK